MIKNVGIIILAAGSSSRLGQSKQLLCYKEKSLLRHTAEQATSSKSATTLVVLGAGKDEHKQELRGLPLLITQNADSERGIGTSIAAGLKDLLKQIPTTDAIVICVCDQPSIKAQIINQLIEQGGISSKGLVACKYADTIGTPALFKDKYFTSLQSLKDTQGAKVILESYQDDLALIDFPEGAIDIDTKTDYINLLNTQPTD